MQATRLPVGRGADGRMRYYRVEVHADAASMRKALRDGAAWLRKQRLCEARTDFAGVSAMTCYFGSWWQQEHADIGCVYFHRGEFGHGVVAHEMTHAALSFISPGAGEFVFTNAMHERLALSVHRLVRGFWRWYYRENIETD